MQDELDVNSDYESETSEDDEEEEEDVYPHAYFDFPVYEQEDADVFGEEEAENQSPLVPHNLTEVHRPWRQRFASE